ncbi:MAG: hypothetical protein EXR08_08345 [Alphaproteobacteria bacterium]|nr:hypothetical protein [Alphaproteobacteria bacterium]
MGHGPGFCSNLDSAGTPIQAGFLTSYDKFVSKSGAALNFGGVNVVDARGGAIPLAASGPAHVDIGGDLMASALGAGQIKIVGVLDVSVLHDLGLPVLPAGFHTLV